MCARRISVRPTTAMPREPAGIPQGRIPERAARRSSNEHAQIRASMKKNAVGHGVSVKRNEGARFLVGRGQYLGDLRFPGMKDVAFLRSPPLGAVLRGRLVRRLRRWADRIDSDCWRFDD
jgi:hypothetical protein